MPRREGWETDRYDRRGKRRRGVAVLCVFATMVSGCAYNSERPSSMNAPSQQAAVQNGNGNGNGNANANANAGPTACMNINEQSIDTGYDSTVAEGVGVGALVGAGLGALLGVLAGGDGKSAAIGAGVGAAAGGVYGASDGVQTAKAKQRYAVQEAQLDCQLVAAKADNAKTATLVAGMRASVADTEKQLAQLEQDYAAKRLSKENAQRELASIDEGTEQLRRSMAALQKRRDEYQRARDTTQQSANNSLDSQELDRQIVLLNSQIASAEQDLNRLLDKRKVAQVG